MNILPERQSILPSHNKKFLTLNDKVKFFNFLNFLIEQKKLINYLMSSNCRQFVLIFTGTIIGEMPVKGLLRRSIFIAINYLQL